MGMHPGKRLIQTKNSSFQALKTYSLETVREKLARSVLIYFFSLYFVVSFVQVEFQGYVFSPPELHTIVLQIILVLITTYLLPRNIQTPLEVFQIFTAVFLTIPTLITSFTNSENNLGSYEAYGSSFAVILNHVILFSLSKCFLKPSSKLDSRVVKSRADITLFSMVILSLLSTIYILSEYQFNSFFGFDEVYNRRAEYLEIVSSAEALLLRYAFGIIGGTLTPLLLIWALFKKNYLVMIYSLFLSVVVYLGSAQKWVFGTLFFVLILFMIHRSCSFSQILSQRIFDIFSFMIWFFIGLQDLFSTSFRIVDLGVRRFLLDPSIMLQYYVAYSKEYPFRFWRDLTPIDWLFKSDTSSDPVAIVLGQRYFYNPDYMFLSTSSKMNATAGAISDSVAQAGLLGLVLTSSILFLFFYFLGKISEGKNSWLVFAVSAVSTYVVCEGTFHTAILSKGLLLVPLVLLLQPRIIPKSIQRGEPVEKEK